MINLPKTIALFGIVLGVGTGALLAAEKPPASGEPNFEKHITPLLDQYCFSCHGNGKSKGDITLDQYKETSAAAGNPKLWERVLHAVTSHEMPPEGKKQPTLEERELIAHWIDKAIFNVDCDKPDPGRVTIRRLNRAEYNNTVRDLIGVDFRPADDFPADDAGYGFDTIGDVLSIPPMMLEKYLVAAQAVLDAALVIHPPQPVKKRYAADAMEVGYNARKRGDGWIGLNSIEEDDVAAVYEVPAEGEFIVRVNAYAKPEGTNTMRLAFMLDKQLMKEVDVKEGKGTEYTARFNAPAGAQRFRVVVRRDKTGLDPKEALEWKSGKPQNGMVFVQQVEIEGPFGAKLPPLPETHRRIFTRTPVKGQEAAAAREILGAFARRAFRRPVDKAELDRLVGFSEAAWKRGETFQEGIYYCLQAIMVSPHFLFRGELQPEPNNPKAIHPINEYALASRLSYFLWSSMPDVELFREAEQGTLRKNLEKQVRRMLADPKATALVENFAGQWLQVRNLKLVTPDPFLFPEFDEELRAAMQRETELFFEHILRADRSVLEMLDADYTFVNERLARHYGMEGVKGKEFRQVSLKGRPRGGVLTHASVLTITSNPTRTSPVKRGKWVLENLLGTPPPPPPPDVPELPDAKGKALTGTLRERLEQHRADTLCASCHARMDPIGFGLENFNAIGGYRLKDGSFLIDPSGQLVTGEEFKGAGELKVVLAEKKKDQFVRCLTEKMLTYALGRGIEYYDKCAVEKIGQGAVTGQLHFSALVLEIVKSTPFQMRRGDETKVVASNP